MTSLEINTAKVFQPLLQPARYKGAKGGRGSGKSHFFADTWLDEQVRMNIDFVCLREVQKDLKFSVKKLLESKIESYNAGFYFDVQDRQILSKLGGVTIFEGMQNHTADSIKSLEKFKRAWFEEAHRASTRSIGLLRPTIRDDDSELWFSWNPEEADDPVDVLLLGENPPPRTVVVHATYEHNPWFPKVLREEMEYDRSRDPDRFGHVWLGEYQHFSEARVFKNWHIEEFERSAGTVFRFGADWGFAIDPSVLVRCSLEGRRLYVDYEAYMVGCEITQLPDLFDRVPESRDWFITADSARPETISYMQKHGYPRMNHAAKGKGSVEEGINFLQSFDIVVHPRCLHTIDELKSYHYKSDPLTGKVLPQLSDKNNHVIDALRYACEAVRRAKPRLEQKAKAPPRPYVGVTGWLAA